MNPNLDTERSARVKRVMRRASYYDHPCFQLFLWYPIPGGQWEIMFGSGHPDEIHYHVWVDRGLDAVAKAWNVDRNMLWPGMGDNVIPTGVVDFKEIEVRGRTRDEPFLILPDPMPHGWDADRVKSKLKCGYRITDVVKSDRRSFQPEPYEKFLKVMKEIKDSNLYRSMSSEPMID